jgi:hypothetical protein
MQLWAIFTSVFHRILDFKNRAEFLFWPFLFFNHQPNQYYWWLRSLGLASDPDLYKNPSSFWSQSKKQSWSLLRKEEDMHG